MNCVELLDRQAGIRPEHTALIEGCGRSERRMSFAELAAASERGAAFLESLGLGAGDPVLVMAALSIDLYTVVLSLLRAGCVAVFVDPSAGPGHLARCLSALPPKAFVGSAKAQLLRLSRKEVRAIPFKICCSGRLPGTVTWGAGMNGRRSPGRIELAPDAPAIVTFTSGSTEAPKAIARTHQFLFEQHRVLGTNLAITADDVVLTTLPVFALSHLADGATVLLPNADLLRPGKYQARPVAAQVERYAATTAVGSPAFVKHLVRECASRGEKLESLKNVFIGGGPVFPAIAEEIAIVALNARIRAVYGSSEAEPIAHLAVDKVSAADRAAMRAGQGILAGDVVNDIELCIIADRPGESLGSLTRVEFERLTKGPNQIGEIAVTGPHVLKSYLGGIGDAENKFSVNGEIWHRTGDAGYLDGKGRLWLVGRCAARVADDRGTLYPFAVECALSEVPGIRTCALVAVENSRVLVLELESRAPRPNLSAIQDAIAWAACDRIATVRTIPLDRRHNSKIDYVALRRMATAASRSGKAW